MINKNNTILLKKRNKLKKDKNLRLFYSKTTSMSHPGCIFIIKKMVCKRYVSMVLAFLSGVNLCAQETDGVEEVMSVLGVDSPEGLDPAELERMADFMSHPLRINIVPESRLLASGLLTRYQVASLTDYRRRHGNVMSFTELAAVDGFSNEIVAKLRSFISLECYSLGEGDLGMQNDMAIKTASKLTGQETALEWNYAIKYRLRSDRFSFSLSSNKSYSAASPWPDAYSGSFTYDFKRFRGRVAVGDFNARFGQGLAVWSGTFMTSLNAPDAFMKKPSGISETWSFTGSTALTGVAGSMSVRQMTLTFMMAMPGVRNLLDKPGDVCMMPAANLQWQGLHGSISMTHVAETGGLLNPDFRIPVMRTSGDAAFCVRGVNLFAELAYDWVEMNLHAVAGTDLPIGEKARFAALLKYLPSRWEGVAAQHEVASSVSGTLGSHVVTFSTDAVRYVEPKEVGLPLSMQFKILADWRCKVNQNLESRVRLSERLRTWGHKTRTDLRADMIYTSGPWNASSRLNYLYCVSHAFVGYAEQGYKMSRVSAYMREGVFFIDDWEDRIYVYERDAPGAFNVPAMYGRGWFASLVLSAEISKAAKLYFRASYTGYDFMPYEKRKPGKAELKFQLVLRYL